MYRQTRISVWEYDTVRRRSWCCCNYLCIGWMETSPFSDAQHFLLHVLHFAEYLCHLVSSGSVCSVRDWWSSKFCLLLAWGLPFIAPGPAAVLLIVGDPTCHHYSCTRDQGHLPIHDASVDRCSGSGWGVSGSHSEFLVGERRSTSGLRFWVWCAPAPTREFLLGCTWVNLLAPSPNQGAPSESRCSASMLDLRDEWTVGSVSGSIST